jgi:hypothetical protein
MRAGIGARELATPVPIYTKFVVFINLFIIGLIIRII